MRTWGERHVRNQWLVVVLTHGDTEWKPYERRSEEIWCVSSDRRSRNFARKSSSHPSVATALLRSLCRTRSPPGILLTIASFYYDRLPTLVSSILQCARDVKLISSTTQPFWVLPRFGGGYRGYGARASGFHLSRSPTLKTALAAALNFDQPARLACSSSRTPSQCAS